MLDIDVDEIAADRSTADDLEDLQELESGICDVEKERVRRGSHGRTHDRDRDGELVRARRRIEQLSKRRDGLEQQLGRKQQ